MIRRILILAACFLVSSGLIARASRTEHIPPREPLGRFPYQIGAWRGAETEPLSGRVLAVLGVDDHLSRFYRSDRAGTVGLYVGYYESQRQGDTIHSPLNCLPGSGWQPISRSQVSIPVSDAAGRTSEIVVNRYVVEKGLDRQVVLYWYQSHGRVIASEYRSKAYMIFDAVRLNRSDAALVRVTTPRVTSEEDPQGAADARAIDFVKAMFPLLESFLPS